MKNAIVFIFTLFSFCLYGQQAVFKINLLSHVTYSESEYSYPGGFDRNDLESKMPIGYSFDLQTELGIGEKLSFLTGLSFSKKSFYPRHDLGLFYDSLTDPEDEERVFYQPYLQQHTFKLLSIPIAIKIDPWNQQKLSPYFTFGFNSSFRFYEEEIFKTDLFFSPEGEQIEDASIAVPDEEFKFFGTSFDMGIGLRYRITNQIGLLFQHQLSLWEFRVKNEKFKKKETFLYDNQLLPLSNITLGVGLQFSF